MFTKPHIALIPLICLACSLPPASDQLQGVWLSDGYGIGAEIRGGSVRSFSVANKTCLDEGSDPLFGLLQVFEVEMAENAQTFLLRQKGTAQTIRFDRVAALPNVCDQPPNDTPLGNFDAFVDIFQTHYAFFDVYGVDWPTRTAQARSKVTAATTEAELFAILSALIAPLRDGHIGLKARIDGNRMLFEPNPRALFSNIRQNAQATGQDPDDAEKAFRESYWLEHIRDRILKGNGVTTGNDFVQYGLIGPKTGYINFLTIAGYASGDIGDLQADIAALHSILDQAIAAFDAAAVDHVVIDMSLNFGGYDEVALAIASRFADQPTFAYAEYPADAQDPITLRRTVTPSDRSRFTGPLTLITSNMTVSAGEILTMSLRALPQTRHVGEATRGALSDVLEKELPNGWQAELSNEVYSDHRGVEWEGRGVPPELRFPVLPPQDPLEAHATAVRRALNSIP